MDDVLITAGAERQIEDDTELRQLRKDIAPEELPHIDPP